MVIPFFSSSYKQHSWWRLVTALLLFLLTLISSNTIAQNPKVYVIDVREEISPGMARKLSRGMDEAQKLKSDLVILNINTYGGLLEAADSMRTRILNAPFPVIAFIDNNAASAGALISIACNRIYMSGGANMGAATVVDETGEPLPDKYQSYMRSIMRSTAEKRGRDPKIAEAMVDPRTYIPGVNDSDKVLTFTTTEAIANGYCEGQAGNINDVLKAEGLENAKLSYFKPTLVDRIISFFINPAVSGVLLLIILGGIYFELQTPGIGFPLLASAVAALLYFVPLYLEGLAENWEILLALVGFVLIVVELFVWPGFGIAGISGIALVVVSFAFSMVGNKGFDFDLVSGRQLTIAFLTVIMSMIASVVIAFLTGRSILTSNRFKKMVLSDTLDTQSGYVASVSGIDSFVGADGVAATLLRPGGKVLIGGKMFDAMADSGYIEMDSKILVVAVRGNTLIVSKN